VSLARLHDLPRTRLALLPTPLEEGPAHGRGGRIWCKRDDLTGLGMGGNKARKLELLCGDALGDGADTLVTVGGAQSNHCRMTAAAGARLGLEVHLVLGGRPPLEHTGNQLLAELFGAHLHFAGTHDWAALEQARAALSAELAHEGRRVATIPIGGSTALGALGFVLAYHELLGQLDAAGLDPAAVVHTSSSGGTHAGLVAGRALAGHGPPVVAIAVAKGVAVDPLTIAALATESLELVGAPVRVTEADVEVHDRWLGPGYEVPTAEADAAIRWAATHAGWVLDRTYTGKGFAGLRGLVGEGRFDDRDVVFWHTGGQPALFAPGGMPTL
jgi:D-cysteine desulfhydrase family pyridoxal phosphate-dependent enzyme